MSDTAASITPISVTTEDGWHVQSSSRAGGARTAEQVKDDATTGLKAEADAAASDDETTPASAAPTPEAPAETPAAEDAKTKKAKHLARQAEIQAKINAIRRQQGEEERRLAEIERKIADRQAQLERVGQAKTDRAASDGDTHAGVKALPPTRAELADMPVWAEYERDGKEFRDYERDKAAWDEQRLEAREAKLRAELDTKVAEQARAKSEAERASKDEAAFFARVDAARAAHEDFDEVVDALGDLRYDDHGMWRDVIQRHPQGPDVLYHLATHPDEAKTLMGFEWTMGAAMALLESEQVVGLTSYLAQHPDETEDILGMSRPRAIRALALIESKLATAGASPASASPVVAPVTRAKAPLTAVAGTRTSGDSKDEYDLPFHEFVKRRNAERAAGRRA